MFERTTFEGQRTHPIKNIGNGNNTKREHFCYKENGRKMYRTEKERRSEMIEKERNSIRGKLHLEGIWKQERERKKEKERERKREKAVTRKTFLQRQSEGERERERESSSIKKGRSIWIFSQVNR